MGFFDNFPYTNFHDLNLDWLLFELRKLENQIENYTAVNKVAYSGVWNITNQYPQWAVVSTNNKTYMSKQPVPVGITITNKDYWIELADLDPRIGGVIRRLDNIHIINALDYGAAGNGVTDDTAALQSAIDATPVHGTLYIPFTGDSYLVSSTLYVKRPISIIGGYIGYEYNERVNEVSMADIGKPLIKYVGSGYAFDFDTLGYLIRGITIVSSGGGMNFHLSDAIVTYSRLGKISECHVVHNNVGFNFKKAFRVTLDNVNSYGGVIGFKVADATSFLFNNTWARNFSDSGYNITDANYCGFNVACCDGEEDKRLIGYYFKDCRTISMSGCGVEGCSFYGILCDNVRGGNINLKFVNCGTLENGAPVYISNYSNMTFVGCHNNLMQESPKVDVVVGAHSVCNILTSAGLATARIINTSYNISNGIWTSVNPGEPLV